MTGTTTLPIDSVVTSIQRTGFWILIDDKEYFVDFEEYPDFTKATVAQIHHFRHSHGELHWDELDVDMEIEALIHPEKYSLKFKK